MQNENKGFGKSRFFMMKFLIGFFFNIYRCMKKISNRKEANTYYKIVNDAIDKFSNETKSTPSEIHRYLSRNGKSFLKRLEINDIEGIDSVLNDVLVHRKNIAEDNIMSFENFNTLNENILTLSPPTVEHEKVLADYFNTSLGHIDLLDPSVHLYSISDFGDKIFAIIIHESEIDVIRKEMCNNIKSEILSKTISISECKGVSINPIKFWVDDFSQSDLIDDYISSKVTDSHLFEFFIGGLSTTNSYDLSDLSSKGKIGEYYLWSK
jgi:hypothetical protein